MTAITTIFGKEREPAQSLGVVRRTPGSAKRKHLIASACVAIMGAMGGSPAHAQSDNYDDPESELSNWMWSGGSSLEVVSPGAPLSINFLNRGTNYSAAYGPATFQAITPLPGTLVLAPSGQLSGNVPTTPGIYQIRVTGTTALGEVSQPATVTIQVNASAPVNNAPLAVADTHQAEIGSVSSAIYVLNNDSDPDNDFLRIDRFNSSTVSIGQPTVVLPSGATVTLSFNGGSILYGPANVDPNLTSDSFTYRISDGVGGTSSATVTVALSQPPPPPVFLPSANNDVVSTSYQTALSINAFLNDASGQDGEPFQLLSHTQPSNGSVAHIANGVFQYTPNNNFSGLDSFSYVIRDDGGQLDTASVFVNVAARANTPPIASNDAVTVEVARDNSPPPPSGSIKQISVLANDSDPDNDALSVNRINSTNISLNESVALPSMAVVKLNANGVLEYDASAISQTTQFINPGVDPDFFLTPESDSFSYQVSDGFGGTATATVQIDFTSTAQTYAPIAQDDSATSVYNSSVIINVLLNDSRNTNDNESISLLGHGQAANGVVSMLANGSLRYSPNAGFYGSDSFDYTIIDTGGQAATATVSITVPEPPPATIYNPVAVDDAVTTAFDTPAIVSALANDETGSDDEAISYDAHSPASSGTVVHLGNGVFEYTPNQGFAGTDSFTYSIIDTGGQTDSASIAIDVEQEVISPPPPPGIATSVSYQYDALGRLTLAVYDNTQWLSYCYDPSGNRTEVQRGLSGAPIDCAQVATDKPSDPDPVPPEADVTGTGDDDVFYDVDGDQTYDGLAGWDRLYFAGSESDYVFSTATDGSGIVTHSDGEVDTLLNIENLDFQSDGSSFGTFKYFGVSAGTSEAETVIGSEMAETIEGLAGNDLLTPKSGDDWVDGGPGWDRANLDGARIDYLLEQFADGPVRATNLVVGEADTFVDVEQIWFFGDQTSYELATAIDVNLGETSPSPPTTDVPPIAVNDSVSTDFETLVSIDALLNDLTGSDNAPFSYQRHTPPSNGSVAHVAGGTFEYTPNQGFVGGDSFTYTIANADGLTDTGLVSLTVDAAPPNQSWSWTQGIIPQDTQASAAYSLDLTTYGVDPENDPVTFIATGLPAGLSLQGGSIQGAATEVGQFLISVEATDAGSGLATATNFTINVSPAAQPGDLPPAAVTLFDDNFQSGTFEFTNGTSTVSVSASGDPVYEGNASLKLNAGVWNQAGIRGNLTIDATSRIARLRVYRPNDGSAGSFRLRHGPSNTAINLNDSNSDYWRLDGQPGLGNPGDMSANNWHLLEIDLIALGITELLAINIVGNATGNDTYFFDSIELAPEFSGGDIPLPIRPQANNDAFAVAHNTPLSIGPLLNDVAGADGQPFSLQSFTQGANGTVTALANDELEYSPNAGFVGADTFSYTIADTDGDTDSATVTLTVGSPAPNQSWSWIQSVATQNVSIGDDLNIDLSAYGNEPEGDAVSFAATGLPPGVTLQGQTIVGAATQAGTYFVSIDATDSGSNIPTSTNFFIEVTDPSTVTPVANLVIFEDDYLNGATEFSNGTSVVGLSGVGEPVYAGNASLKLTTGVWDQAGIRPNHTIDATTQILRLRVYRPSDGSSGDFKLRHGPSNTAITLDASNGASWRLDGQQGQGELAAMSTDTWHLVEVDLNALGITELRAVNIHGNATGNDTYYFDQVEFTDQFSSASGGTSPPPPPPPAPPQANDDAVTTPFETAISIDGLANDATDANQEAFVHQSHTQGGNGSVTHLGSGVFEYTPNTGFSGLDTFTYTIVDTGGQTDTATVSVTVEAASGTGLPVANLVIFEDDYLNGATEFSNGTSVVGLSGVGEPVYAGNSSLKLTTGVWDQAGIRPNHTIDATTQILRLRVYRPSDGSSGDFKLRHGPSNTAITLDASNGASWRLDGQQGQGELAAMSTDTWHLVEVDLNALGITELRAVNIHGNATGNDTYYFDQVEFTDQFSSGGSN